MWKVISPAVDFHHKIVLDLGCGYFGFSRSAKEHGALVISVDKVRHPEVPPEADFVLSDLNFWVMANGIPPAIPLDPDIIACFSVLPYLRNPQATLRMFKDMAKTTLIECQYADDGPGYSFIHNDDDMKKWFQRVGWNHIEKLGETFVPGRNKHRSIWLLEG